LALIVASSKPMTPLVAATVPNADSRVLSIASWPLTMTPVLGSTHRVRTLPYITLAGTSSPVPSKIAAGTVRLATSCLSIRCSKT
jgi:hypothetical protein